MPKKPGNLFIVSAPSGTGKTTLVQALTDTIPDLFVSVSHTTRPQRPSEEGGVNYHFVDRKTFDAMAGREQFLEYARVFDHYYGTSRVWVEEQLARGSDIILEIDWQGGRQIRSLMPGAIGIFILPPSYESLQKRLQARGDAPETVARRMRDATRELSHYAEYDYLVINDDLETALGQLADIIRGSAHAYRAQQAWFDEFVGKMLRDARDLQ
ncbi:MAG: guanylate kinase [Gammaproteobacteria bacterium]